MANQLQRVLSDLPQGQLRATELSTCLDLHAMSVPTARIAILQVCNPVSL